METDIQSSGSTDAARALLNHMTFVPRRSMTRRARETRVLAHVRQFCALGLPSRMVIQHILESLREVIGSDVGAATDGVAASGVRYSSMRCAIQNDGVTAFTFEATAVGVRVYEQVGFRTVIDAPVFVIGASTQFPA
jgi:hypothetical protein